ncbi:phosphotransferase family protein [Sulfobacillus harzensis]|uniref:Aminoglycoside phosphotransferase family protein n=1 Tax=Sulfobacillus harzensis TaxID=2729629 RepID=A0A7Y0Q1B8_9FIRM|nr:aminoglycoside phosphotransferase family protein [Sulfobacillus harzensis]NMP21287.1 aminoglycoside phosphotransferase family protein [Sulfobacillus harzensis]
MPKDVYLQPDAPDPVLDSDLVLSLAGRHVSGLQSITAIDESGGEARVYVVDDSIIVKTQRPHRLRPRTSLAKETVFLDALKDQGIAVPRVLGYGREGFIEYIVMTRIPGVAVIHASIPPQARQQMLFQLGRTLARIHAVPQAPFLESGLFPTEMAHDTFRDHVAEVLLEGARRIYDFGIHWPIAGLTPDDLVRRATDALPRTPLRTAIHSNPGPTHTFVDPVTGEFQGLIDFGDAFVTHPAWDLRRWTPREREALLAGYEADRTVEAAFLQTFPIIGLAVDLVQLASDKAAIRQAAEADLTETMASL